MSFSPVLRSVIRPGVYYDSVVLMRVQRSLAALPEVLDAGVVMATPANREILAAGSLLPEDVASSRADDLLIVIRAASAAAAEHALSQVDELLRATHVFHRVLSPARASRRFASCPRRAGS